MNLRAPRFVVTAVLAGTVAFASAACGGAAVVNENTDSASSGSASSSDAGASSTSSELPDDAVVVEVTIEGDEVSPNAELIEAEIGQPVVFQITSDTTTEIHGHATPEFTWAIEPGTSQETLTYDEPVSVTIELHDPARTLVQLVVR